MTTYADREGALVAVLINDMLILGCTRLLARANARKHCTAFV